MWSYLFRRRNEMEMYRFKKTVQQIFQNPSSWGNLTYPFFFPSVFSLAGAAASGVSFQKSSSSAQFILLSLYFFPLFVVVLYLKPWEYDSVSQYKWKWTQHFKLTREITFDCNNVTFFTVYLLLYLTYKNTLQQRNTSFSALKDTFFYEILY